MSKEFKRVNDPIDLETVIPEPVPGITGFYYCPLDRRLGVDINGDVVNIRTGKIIKPIRNNSNGGMYIIITSPGVKHKGYFHHRIIARTLIGRPSRHLDKEFSSLHVNHIDGNRTNNNPSNLEWVTNSENVIHARDNELRQDNDRVLVKSIDTGMVISIISVRECAAMFNIKHATLHKHLNSRTCCKMHKDGHLFQYDTGNGWITIPDELKHYNNKNEIGNGTRIFGVIKVVGKGMSYIFETITEISKYLKIPYKAVFRNLKRHNEFNIGDYQFNVITRL